MVNLYLFLKYLIIYLFIYKCSLKYKKQYLDKKYNIIMDDVLQLTLWLSNYLFRISP